MEIYAKPILLRLFRVQEPFVNHSAPCVREKHSLHRTFVMFRTLGLRHLVVVDSANRVVGIISRKDLIGHALERKLQHALIHAALEQHEPA